MGAAASVQGPRFSKVVGGSATSGMQRGPKPRLPQHVPFRTAACRVLTRGGSEGGPWPFGNLGQPRVRQANALRALGTTETVPSLEPLHTARSGRYRDLILIYLTRKFCTSQRAAEGLVGGSGSWVPRKCVDCWYKAMGGPGLQHGADCTIHQHAAVIATWGGRAVPRLPVARRSLVKGRLEETGGSVAQYENGTHQTQPLVRCATPTLH